MGDVVAWVVFVMLLAVPGFLAWRWRRDPKIESVLDVDPKSAEERELSIWRLRGRGS